MIGNETVELHISPYNNEGLSFQGNFCITGNAGTYIPVVDGIPNFL